MQRTSTRLRYLAPINLLSATLLSCASHGASIAAKTAHGAPAVGTSVPDAPPTTLQVTRVFAPGSLHAIPQKPLVLPPDAWDPTGTLVGHVATCEVWETATGLYRGALPPTVCAAWKRQEAQLYEGRWTLEVDKAQLWLVDSSRTLLDDGCRASCAPWIAWSPRRDGRRVAGLRRGSDQLVVWDMDERRVVNRWQLAQPLASSARIAWHGDELVVVGQTKTSDWTGMQFSAHDAVQLLTLDLAANTAADLDPFGHWLFQQGFEGARDGFGPPMRQIQGIGGDSPKLTWEFEAKRKDAPPVLSRDGTACAFLSRVDTEERGVTKDLRVLFTSGFTPEAWSVQNVSDPSIIGFAADASAMSIVENFGSSTRLRTMRRDSGGTESWSTALPNGNLVEVTPSKDGRMAAVRFADHVEVRDAEGKPLLFWTGIPAMAWQADDELVVRRDDGSYAARDVRTKDAVVPVPSLLAPATGGPLRTAFRCEAAGVLRRVADGAALRFEGDAVRTDAWVYDNGYGVPAVALREGSDPVVGSLADPLVMAAVLGRADVLADFVAGKGIPVPEVLAKEP